MRARFVVASLLALFLVSLPGWGADATLFHASFDTSYLPEKALGGAEPPFMSDKTKFVYAPGKVGNCIQVAAGQQLVYEGEGNAYMAAGTISFFWRPDADVTGKSFLILDTSPLERINYSRFLKIQYSGDTIAVIPFAGPGGMVRADSFRGQFKQGEWHHIAMAWDQGRGLGMYIDGKPIPAYKGTWSYDGNFNHIGLGLETRPDFRPDTASFSQSYDELTVYDRWLSDAQIAELAEGKQPQIGTLDATAYLSMKRKVNGWEAVMDLKPVVTLGDEKGMGLRQVGAATAKDVKRSNWMVFDGERARWWPGSSGYYNRGRALDFTLHPGQSFDVVQILGRGQVNLVQAGNDTALAGIADKTLGTMHTVLAAPVSGEAFQLVRPGENPGVVNELNLFQTVPFAADALQGANGWQRLSLAAPGEAERGAPEMTAIAINFYTCDQQALFASEAKGQGKMKLPAMRAVHILAPAHAARQGLGAVALDLAISASIEPNVLRVDVIDPLNPERYITTADVRVAGTAGRLRLMIDMRDQIYQPNQRPRIVVTFRNDTEIDLADSAVSWRWISVADALPQFAPDQFARARDIFQEISEARPWGYKPNSLKALRLMGNGIDTLHALQPDDAVLSSYWHWIHPGEQKIIIKFPEPPAGVPAWAMYLDDAIEQCKKMPAWWIANRENDHGEFGPNDGINDDTDLVQDWWALHLMRGPDKMLYDSLYRVTENSWYNCMLESGLGHYTDALHTYEDGPNAQAHMALMAYGNPVYMERLFKTVSHYKDLLAVYPKCGHLHFRGSYYGTDRKGGVQLDPKNHGWDDGDNSLALQPGMLVAWYNANPNCRKTVIDWTDGMMAHDMANLEKNKALGGASINTTTGEERMATSYVHFGYGFFSCPWACYEFTGDKKYLDFIKLGIDRDVRDYRHIRQTSCVVDRYIQETGDVSLKDRYVAATKEPYLWKSSIHNDDYFDIDAFYEAWQTTGDLSFLTEGLKLSNNDIIWELPMLTMGEQSTDRVWLPQRLLNKVALGGAAMVRNETYPKQALSYENATGRVAPMVKMQNTKEFQVWLVNLEEKEATVNLRIWRLDHGKYEVTEGLDANQDGTFDGQTKKRTLELARFDIVPVTLPPRTVYFVTCKQTQPLDDIRLRTDLAICTNDVTYDAAAGKATVRVHNIGSKPTGAYDLRIKVGAAEKREQGASLEAPLDCTPKIAEFSIAVPDPQQTITVEIDPGNKIPEITEVNNAISFVPAKLPAPWPVLPRK